jgi:uncharacterized protein (TIGR03118 family)
MRTLSVLSLILVSLLSAPLGAGPLGYNVTNLASDVPGLAVFTDPTLINAWGIAASGGSPQWLGANGSGTSPIYNGAGVKQGLQVTIPGDGSVTGVAFNANAASSFNGDAFLFVSEDGTFSGWRGALGTNAEVLGLADPANVYKGLAEGSTGGFAYAYAANFRTGNIDIFKGSAGAPDLAGNFVDPALPAGYAPFNIALINGALYVTYALQDGAKKDEISGPGNGFVSKFGLDGSFQGRVISNGALNSPWGLAVAPSVWGDFGGALLVGNFGDGKINAFDLNGVLLGTLSDSGGNPISIDGLWGLRFGNGGNGGAPNQLFFTAGPEDESHGLFGDIVPIPEPSTITLAAAGLLLFLHRRRTVIRP